MFELNNSEIGPSVTRIAIAIGVFGLLSVFYLGTNVVFILWIAFLLALLVRDLIHDRSERGCFATSLLARVSRPLVLVCRRVSQCWTRHLGGHVL